MKLNVADGTLILDSNSGNLPVKDRNVYTFDIPPNSPSDGILQISLRGSKFAREWSFHFCISSDLEKLLNLELHRSFSSAIAGYGFDIVWGSGTLWSFLAEDQISCKRWVESINKSIKLLQRSIHNEPNLLSSGGTDIKISMPLHSNSTGPVPESKESAPLSQSSGSDKISLKENLLRPFPRDEPSPPSRISNKMERNIHSNIETTRSTESVSTSTSFGAVSSSAAATFSTKNQRYLSRPDPIQREDIPPNGSSNKEDSFNNFQLPLPAAGRYRDELERNPSHSLSLPLPERKIDDSFSDATRESHAMLYKRSW